MTLQWLSVTNRANEVKASLRGNEIIIRHATRGLRYFEATYRGAGHTRMLGSWPTADEAKSGVQGMFEQGLI